MIYREKISDAFARHAGYNEVAEINNIIIIYPQAVASSRNPNGDWDWWGFNNMWSGTHCFSLIKKTQYHLFLITFIYIIMFILLTEMCCCDFVIWKNVYLIIFLQNVNNIIIVENYCQCYTTLTVKTQVRLHNFLEHDLAHIMMT